MLQLASGNSVSVLTNCGACRDREPAEELRLPILKGLVGDKTVDVLRDTGCEGVVVRRGLVKDSQLTGKSCLLRRIDNTTLLAEKAVIAINTPYLSGQVEALCIPKAICDLVVGNVEGARNPDDPDKSVMVGAMTTGAQERKEAKSRPLQVPKEEGHGDVNRTPLIQPQGEDPAIQAMVQVKTPEVEGRKALTFERTKRSRSESRSGRSQPGEGPRRLRSREGKRSRSRQVERRENRKETRARERSERRSRSRSRSSSHDEVTKESCKSRTPGEKKVSPPVGETEVEDEPIEKVEKPANFSLMTQKRTFVDDENGEDDGGGKKKQDDEIDPPDAYRHCVHDDEEILEKEDKRVVTENDKQAKVVLYIVTIVKKKEEDRGEEKGELRNALEERSSGEEKEDMDSTMAHWYKRKKDFGAESHGKVYFVEVPESVQMTSKEFGQLCDEMVDVFDGGKHSLKPTKSWAQCTVRKKVMELMRKYNYEDLTPIQARPFLPLCLVVMSLALLELAMEEHWPSSCQCLDMWWISYPSRKEVALLLLWLFPSAGWHIEVQLSVNSLPILLDCVLCVYMKAHVSQSKLQNSGMAVRSLCVPGSMSDMLKANNRRVTNLKCVAYIALDGADRIFEMHVDFEPRKTEEDGN